MKRTFSPLIPLSLLACVAVSCTAEADGPLAEDAKDRDETTSTDDTDTDVDSDADDDSDSGGSDEEQVFAECEQEFTITAPNPDAVWTPNAIQLVSEELAEGVFAVYDSNAPEYGPAGLPLATSGGFVVGDDTVVLIESMVNRQLLCKMVDLVREQTEKPIGYVINTSFHGDHSFGNAFLPEDVQIVQHQRTTERVTSDFAAELAFLTPFLGADQGIDEAFPVEADVQVSDEGWSIDLGEHVVQAMYFGVAQTEGDLFVWVPDAKVLWTGNAMVAREPVVPWLLEGYGEQSKSTLSQVRAFLPSGTVIVPGHDGPIAAEGALDFGIDYLATLLDGVQASLLDGLTLAQTVEALPMIEFQGYALFDFLHTQVNVPNTYMDLSGS